MDLALKGRTALVTGSHRGTGEVIAATLAAEGAQVIYHCMTEQQHAELSGVHAVWGDISTEDGAQQVAQQLDELPPVDILVANYGTAGRGRWQTLVGEDWLDMLQHNVLSATRMVQATSPAMRARGWGRIVFLGTIGSSQPNNIMPHYYAAKAALANAALSLAKELSDTGITVNTVSPGFVRTDEVEAYYRQRAIKAGRGDSWADIERFIVEQDFPNPCGRIAERQEVADLVAFICSERAGFINAQNIRVDGGALRMV